MILSGIFFTLFCTAFAIANRARGSKLFNNTDSTVISRVAATLTMAILTYVVASQHGISLIPSLRIFAWTWASLMFWCSFGWEEYTSAAMGFPNGHSRLWGLASTTIRMLLILPCIGGVAMMSQHSDRLDYASLSLFMGLPYYLFGYLTPGQKTTRNAELTVGAIIGTMIWMVL